MAAVVVPTPHDRWDEPVRLRLLPAPRPGCRRRPTPAVYRRRRLAVGLLLGVIVAAVLLVTGPVLRASVGALGGSPLAPSGAPAVRDLRPVAAQTYVVQPGDTFWSLARRMQPSGDIRPLVDRLVALHHGATLQPGDRVAVP